MSRNNYLPYEPRLDAQQIQEILDEVETNDTVFTNLVSLAEKSDEVYNVYQTYCLLLLRGEEGFTKILDIAIIGRKVKHRSIALTIFSVIAKDGLMSNRPLGNLSAAQLNAINGKLRTIDAHRVGNKFLNRLTLAIPENDFLMPTTMSLLQMTLGTDERYAKSLIESISHRWLKFGPGAIEDYKTLLETRASDEPPFQEFFKKHPQFLDPMALQIWSQPDFHGALEPDFIVRRFDDTYLVVEIEKPSKTLITKGGNLSAQATAAEQQAIDYREFLNDRIMEARNHFPNYKNAECLTIIGMEDEFSERQTSILRQANANRAGNSKIVGFDRLLNRARSMFKNLEAGEIEVIDRARLI